MSLLMSALAAGALVACGGPTQLPAAAPVSVPVATPPTSAVIAPAAAVPPGGGSVSWTMPNLVGANLQDAQNAIQRLTSNAIFVTTSHDATGAGRHQVVDRNWRVCSQNVPPGSTIQAGTKIDFVAVKLQEHCP
ncbi:MAG: PASTA domain-containing protein [Pseudonocardiaceae bacterium]